MSKTWTKGSRASTSMSLANTKPRAKHRMIQKRPVTSCRPEAISPVRGRPTIRVTRVICRRCWSMRTTPHKCQL